MIEQSLDKLQQNFICWEYYNVIRNLRFSIIFVQDGNIFCLHWTNPDCDVNIILRSSDNKRISLNSRPVIVLQWRPNAIGRHRSGPVSMASFVQTREFPWLISSRKWLLSTSSFVLSCWTISCPSCKVALSRKKPMFLINCCWLITFTVLICNYLYISTALLFGSLDGQQI